MDERLSKNILNSQVSKVPIKIKCGLVLAHVLTAESLLSFLMCCLSVVCFASCMAGQTVKTELLNSLISVSDSDHH